MNVVIVDREPAGRAALAELCSRTEGVRVVGQAATGAKAIEAAHALGPDLMLIDAQLPDMTGLEVLRAMRAGRRRRSILLTANHRDNATAYAAGAEGEDDPRGQGPADRLMPPGHERGPPLSAGRGPSPPLPGPRLPRAWPW